MSIPESIFETRCLSSLVKVFPDQELDDTAFNKSSAFRNETYSFQVAYRNNGKLLKNVKVKVESNLAEHLSLRIVGLVPSELPSYGNSDGWVLRSTPGLYPDPLIPLTAEGITAFPHQWRSIWVTVELNNKAVVGEQKIEIAFEDASGNPLGSETFHLEVFPEELPVQTLIHTEWFHTDCLAVQYQVDVFSEEYWKLVEKYVETAAKHGVNMILTPLFTPPLDTEVGAERPTVQLINVEKRGQSYQFSFDRLKKWIDLCQSKGILYFEFAHFFTQWGAKSAPKIIACEDGQTKRIFGWETDATGKEYQYFLSQFLPELIEFIEQQRLEHNIFFHVSDEPSLEHLESYQKASQIINRYLGQFPVIDALSDYQFYKNGIVRHPIPSNDHIDAFIKNEVPDLWTYYCCLQNQKVSNRFFNFPSARNRIIGFQLYKFNIKGFLHWGYNFWFSRLSKYKIDPFKNTDAGYGFPSGDAFLVYPGEEGPIESIRMEIFYEALQDLRALNLLESLIGRELVIELLEKALESPLTFTVYPQSDDWILNIREEINLLIAENMKKIGEMT